MVSAFKGILAGLRATSSSPAGAPPAPHKPGILRALRNWVTPCLLIYFQPLIQNTNPTEATSQAPSPARQTQHRQLCSPPLLCWQQLHYPELGSLWQDPTYKQFPAKPPVTCRNSLFHCQPLIVGLSLP